MTTFRKLKLFLVFPSGDLWNLFFNHMAIKKIRFVNVVMTMGCQQLSWWHLFRDDFWKKNHSLEELDIPFNFWNTYLLLNDQPLSKLLLLLLHLCSYYFCWNCFVWPCFFIAICMIVHFQILLQHLLLLKILWKFLCVLSNNCFNKF